MSSDSLTEVALELVRILTEGAALPARFADSAIHRETVWVSMRDGIRLATDLHLPPNLPAPAIAVRTPYGRADAELSIAILAFGRAGYAVISQDCRGTGDSEPDDWDCYVYEREDSIDFVEWVTKQKWFDGFLGGCGGSYLAQTQWCMGFHPGMSAIAPEVGGLGVAFNTARLHMTLNAYSRSVGKGAEKVQIPFGELEHLMLAETLATGYFNEALHRPFSGPLLARYPILRSLAASEGKRWLWEQYCGLNSAGRAGLVKHALGEDSVTASGLESLSGVFGQHVAIDTHTVPSAHPSELVRSLRTPALMITGWYDWALNDALATWQMLSREAPEPVRSRCRLIIAPGAHNAPGYHEGESDHPELARSFRTPTIVDLLDRWYSAVRTGTTDGWPTVIYYLMGANEWRVSDLWPPRDARRVALYLDAGGSLVAEPRASTSRPDQYTYRPESPPPTLGGSILSHVLRPGSVDVSEVQNRPDVLAYTSAPLDRCLDVVGPLRLILYASSSAVDTDFSGRVSDVFPDGRAIQLQSGILRTRYRRSTYDPELLDANQIYRLEVDLCATANRFERGHRLRLDICSADFPKFERNANRGGEPGPPIAAVQSIYHGVAHPSHLQLSVLNYESS